MAKKPDSSLPYPVLRRKAIFNFTSVLSLAAGVFGLFLMLAALAAALAGSADSFVAAFIPGVFLSIAIIPGLYRSGIELDGEQRRFREYDGTLGRNKGQWIDIETGDYLSIVGVHETRSGSMALGSALPTVHLAMSKVYFFSGDWHLEVYKGHYEDALKFAKRFAEVFDLLINDVNEDQNLNEASQSGFNV